MHKARLIAGVIFGLLFTVLIASATLSQLQSRGAPASAIALWPWNGTAYANLAVGEQAEGRGTDAQRAARRALRFDGLNPTAARVLAVEAVESNQLKLGLDWLAYSEAVSRRDAGTQLMMIELAVSRGDVSNALRHYDRALRTSEESYATLFPVLLGAAADPAIRHGVIALLQRQPYWRSAFLQRLITARPVDQATFEILRGARLQPNHPVERDLLAQAIRKFTDTGAVRKAQVLLGVRSDIIYNGGFDSVPAFAPIDWQLTDDIDMNASIETAPIGQRGNALFFAAHNGNGGLIASQMLALTPGTYAVAYAAGDLASEQGAKPIFTVACFPSQRTLMDHLVVHAGSNLRTQSFTVDGSCPVQRLAIRTTAELADVGAAPSWIDGLRLTRVP